MDGFLKLIGYRRDPNEPTFPLLRTWHSYAVLAIALLVAVSMCKVF